MHHTQWSTPASRREAAGGRTYPARVSAGERLCALYAKSLARCHGKLDEAGVPATGDRHFHLTRPACPSTIPKII